MIQRWCRKNLFIKLDKKNRYLTSTVLQASKQFILQPSSYIQAEEQALPRLYARVTYEYFTASSSAQNRPCTPSSLHSLLTYKFTAALFSLSEDVIMLYGESWNNAHVWRQGYLMGVSWFCIAWLDPLNLEFMYSLLTFQACTEVIVAIQVMLLHQWVKASICYNIYIYQYIYIYILYFLIWLFSLSADLIMLYGEMWNNAHIWNREFGFTSRSRGFSSLIAKWAGSHTCCLK